MTANDWQSLASVTALEQRAEIVWWVRSFFHQHGFHEVQTPTVSRDTVLDRYIDPIEVAGRALGCAAATAERYFLQTSPEFCMKRLLALGMRAIYQIGPAYRAGERGELHNLEFTMLEWYRAGETLVEALAFLRELTDGVLVASGQRVASTSVVTYQQIFQQLLDVDPMVASIDELQQLVVQQGMELGSSWADQSRDDWLNLLFAECIQPRLGHDGPIIVSHYPASQAALAQVCPSDRQTAQRYELFVRGIELANGYHELLDADELAKRNLAVAAERGRDGKAPLPLDSRLQDAMRAGLPQSCGCALGIDRLILIALKLRSIDQVIAFPIERA